MKITNTDIKLSTGTNEKVKAYVSITLDDCFVIHNIRVIEGNNNLFIAMPSYKSNDKFIDICHPINKDFRDYLNETIINEYLNKCGESNE
jgi:stage V sporulation protein G